jgi:periplasmic divalent cation tolerance protein
MAEAIIAMTTTNSEKEARHLADILVRGKIAACVQIVPKIHSIYEWEGKVHDEQEYLLLIKTREDLAKKVKAAIEEEHSYEVPEFLVVPVIDSTESYMRWMCDMTK